MRDFPRTRFVFAHCGMSRRVNVPFYHQMVERLLEQYPNLCVDYSWIIFDVAICPDGQPERGLAGADRTTTASASAWARTW